MWCFDCGTKATNEVECDVCGSDQFTALDPNEKVRPLEKQSMDSWLAQRMGEYHKKFGRVA